MQYIVYSSYTKFFIVQFSNHKKEREKRYLRQRERVLEVSTSMRMYLLFQQTEGGNFLSCNHTVTLIKK